MIAWNDSNSPFHRLLSLGDAAEIWKIDSSTIRKAIAARKMVEGQDCMKYGKQWVVTVDAMAKTFRWGPNGGYSPWSNYKSECIKRSQGEPNLIDEGKLPIP